ncbi:MAG: hypothetical protein OEZ00_02050 [Dehalococcoidia bacterium]|nr:hypothetical protein [Dehalococcoidia bacterium]
MRFKYTEVIGSVQSKAPVPEGQWRSGKERSAPIIIEGVQISRVTLPKAKGGGRDLSELTLNSIRKQLLLCRDQFIDFVGCPMTMTDYIEKMKAKFVNISEPIDSM